MIHLIPYSRGTKKKKKSHNHYLISVQLSHSVVSNSLGFQGPQHARLPCPSTTPGVYLNSCPSRQLCHSTISSSFSPSLPTFNLSQHQGLFKWVSSSHQVAKVLELQPYHQSFQWIFRTDRLLDRLVGSPCSPRDSQESSPTPQFTSIISSVISFPFFFFGRSAFLIVQLMYPYMTTGKTIVLTRWDFVGKIMSLLFNMLSRLS